MQRYVSAEALKLCRALFPSLRAAVVAIAVIVARQVRNKRIQPGFQKLRRRQLVLKTSVLFVFDKS